MKKTKRKPYNIYDRKRVGFQTQGASKTKQEQSSGCDINLIMKRYLKTGELTHIKENPRYGDFQDAQDYQTTLENVLQAQEDFQALPSNIRDYFNNDPANLLDFMSDSKNTEKAQELGLISKPETTTATNTAQNNEDKGTANEAKQAKNAE